MENTKALCIAGQKAVTLCVRYDLTHLKVSADMARGVAVAVDEFRDYLMERSIPNLVDKVLDVVPSYITALLDDVQVADLVILGVEEAIIERNSKMHSTEKQHEIAK